MIALIDADIVVYQAAARAEQVDDFDDDRIYITGSKSQTRDGIASMIHDLCAALGADRSVLAFTCTEGNFRKEVYPKYKSNRKGHRKPVTYAYGREWAIENYESMSRPTLEADDILAILATGDVKGMRGKKVVCSIDKDMRTFPCSLYNWMRPEDGIVTFDEVDADYEFFAQILTGDSTDGYPGCPGIGPVKAERIVDAHYDYWNSPDAPPGHSLDRVAVWQSVVDAYEKKGLTEYDAITQARCARILRACDYNFEDRQPILWTPPRRETSDDEA